MSGDQNHEISQRFQRTDGKYSPLDFMVSAILTDTQLTAVDLYGRGLNVIPLKPHEKRPYVLEPFFTSRLHHCGAECHHKGKDDVTELFVRKNIGVLTGRTSGNLLAIDCDSHVAFLNMGQELGTRKLPFWALSGYRGGAYLLRVIEGEVGNVPKSNSKFADVEIWGNRHLVVIPPSLHPLGLIYQWVTPEPRFALPPFETIAAVSIKSLDWLGVTLQNESRRTWEAPQLLGLPRWAAVLSYRNRETYAAKLNVGDRNHRITALAYDMAANGIDYGEAQRIILDIADRCNYPNTPYTRKEACAVLKSAYSKPREPAQKRADGLRTWQPAKLFAESYDWRGNFGRKALKRQAVYLACIERARQDGREVWRATERELAEHAGTGTTRKTVRESLRDLQLKKLIKRISSPGEAGLFRFEGLSKIVPLYKTCSYSGSNLDAPKTPAEQDVFAWFGLVAWYVWQHLLTQPEPTAAAIAHAIDRPRSSVYAALKKLLDPMNGRFVVIAEGMYYGEPKTDSSLAEIAAFLHSGGSPSRTRKEKHRLERERRVNQLVSAAIARAGH